MLQLTGALAAPVVGALLYRWLHERPGTVRLVDRFMYVVVPALVLWQVLPHAWAEHGALAVVALAAGVSTPALIERASHAAAPHADSVALLAGLSGLALHASLEGAALAPEESDIALAVILHRVPVGLVIWWMLEPRYGFVGGALGIGAIVAATVLGYAVGSTVIAAGGGVELYQAFVGGSLVHVVFHQSRHDHSHHGHPR